MTEIDDIIKKISPYYKEKKEASRKQFLVYDSSTETLEPVYFWILDFMNDMFRGKVKKITDNFASSAGSGHFSEIQGKATHMQQEASRLLGTINTILKSVINLIYDIKEFNIRLSHYEAADSKDQAVKEAGILALKQIWMDKVDILRGQGSINALTAGELNFVTLRDAFLAAKSVEDINNLDLNERVQRVLKPRLQEFFEWKKRSKQELEKRYEIEKTYLKSQVNALKLQSKWAKPYLKAAQQLVTNENLSTNAALVNIFNTVMLELTIMGTNKFDVSDAVNDRKLPKEFKKMKIRNYNSVLFIDFTFRGIPSRTPQGNYVFGGRAEVTFKAYVLDDDELLLLEDELDKSDLNDSLKLVEGMTEESLEQLKLDIEDILGKEKEEEKKEKIEITNPFTALFDFKFFKEEKKESKEERLKKIKEKGIKRPSYTEKYARALAEADAIDNCFTIYDVYKKSHGMATFPYGGGSSEPKAPQSEMDKFMGFK